MFFKHFTTAVVGVSSFCLGVWLDRKYKKFDLSVYSVPGFQIFDAVNADSVINNNQQLIVNNEHRISEVRQTIYLNWCYM